MHGEVLKLGAMVSGREWAVILACYVLGCFTIGYYWARWRAGLDIRQHGSGSVGARNVGRVLGPTGFLVTLLGDLTKGALAVGLATFFRLSPDAVVACMVAAVAGHTWPFQLRFQGGKGIATSLGCILAYDPLIAAMLGVLFLPCYAVLRSFTLGGLLALALCPLLVFWSGLENVETAAASLLAMVVLLAHRRNLREEFSRHFPRRPAAERLAPDSKDPDA